MASNARYIEISNDLERKIVNGELQGRLPGVIRLTDIYRAGQSTVKRAIAELTKKGMVVCDSTRGTFITGYRRPDNHFGVICVVGVIFDEPQNQAFIAELNRITAARGYSILQVADITSFSQLRPGALAELPCDGYLVIGLTSELAAALRRSGKSVVALNCCEGIIEGVPWVDFDWASAYREFFQYCRENNLRKVALAAYDNRKFNFRDKIFKYYLDGMGDDFNPDYFFARLNERQLHAKYGSNHRDHGGKMLAEYYASLSEPPEVVLIHIAHEFADSFCKYWPQVSKAPMPQVWCVTKDAVFQHRTLYCDYADLYAKALELLFADMEKNSSTSITSMLSPIKLKI